MNDSFTMPSPSDPKPTEAELKGVVDEGLSAFVRDVNRLYDRRAIGALRGACGQPYGISLPPRPLILEAALQHPQTISDLLEGEARPLPATRSSRGPK